MAPTLSSTMSTVSLSSKVNIPKKGDNSVQTLEFAGDEVVAKMKVKLPGSAAIDDLKLCVGEEAGPDKDEEGPVKDDDCNDQDDNTPDEDGPGKDEEGPSKDEEGPVKEEDTPLEKK